MNIKWKFISIFLLLFLLPLLSITFYFLNQGQKIIKEQALNDLTLAAELTEGHIFSFFERQKIRTVDWSSDGHIRKEIEAIINTGDSVRAYKLGKYIKTKKHPLDSTVTLTDILDLSGRVIVSTDENRIGVQISKDKINFTEAKNAKFGKAFVSKMTTEVMEEIKSENGAMFHITAPLVSLSTNKNVGILLIHVLGSELNDVLSGEHHIKLGSPAGKSGRPQTLELYLVNQKGLMITPSRFIQNSVLRQKVDTLPVRLCLEGAKEFSGSYQDYRGASVYGASMCPKEQWWMLLTKIDEKEILAGFDKLQQVVITFSAFLIAIVIFLASFFGKRFIRRINDILNIIGKISKGNFEARADVSWEDEIGLIGSAINSAARSLADLTGKQTLLSLVIKNSAEGIMITSIGPRGPMHHITYVNPAWEKLFGYKGSEVINKESPRILNSGKQNAEFYNKLWATIMLGKFFRADIINKRKDGILIDVETVVVPVKDKNSKIINYFAAYRDITERKKNEARIRELNELRNKFIRIVSHQLRTPLNSIRWNLEALLAEELGKLKKEQREFIRVAHESSIEIIRRIHDLLTAMDIEERRISITKEKISLESLWGSVMLGWKKKCASKNVNCIYQAPEKPLPLISVDAEKIRQVFEILSDNAVIYTPEKKEEGERVIARFKKVDNKVRFEIIDTGIGIPKFEQSKIFTRFFRATNASVMKTDASGLGLSIAKFYIDEHGGKIGFTSEEGKGSTFWFELPISTAPNN